MSTVEILSMPAELSAQESPRDFVAPIDEVPNAQETLEVQLVNAIVEIAAIDTSVTLTSTEPASSLLPASATIGDVLTGRIEMPKVEVQEEVVYIRPRGKRTHPAAGPRSDAKPAREPAKATAKSVPKSGVVSSASSITTTSSGQSTSSSQSTTPSPHGPTEEEDRSGKKRNTPPRL
ncbi:hypothetical protein CERSUDRAFT_115460 [Gelatoporia subvermispora B]|uniref:Uncharacterized protein n=1 Tax=Ceriporiopsis subvermispora (strain B) TaxID=914234 RepID=M2QHF4_CERS8|nr:hypothetical protein CERSUDRAFT_115460 [Gelatoporia subvermispora B]